MDPDLPVGVTPGVAVWLRPGWRRLVLATGLGAAMAAGQAPLDAWFATLPALCALIWLVSRAESPRRAATLGWFAGAGYFAGAMFWIVEPFLIDLSRHGWMAPFALLGLSFGMGLFWMAAAGLAALLGRGPVARAAAFVVTLTGAELARSYVLTGLPWALIGHVWLETPMAQAASVVGPVGLTLLTVLAAALPVIWRGRGVALALVVLAPVWVWGGARLAVPEALRTDAPLLRLVQPNAEQHLKWRDDMAMMFFERQLDQTAQTRPDGRFPDLVIWGETAVPWLLNRPGDALQMMADAADGARVAFGIQRSEGFRYFNALAVIGPDAQILATYDKFHLVPFGEYIPFGDLLANVGITAFAAREGNGYTGGAGAQVLDLGPLGLVQPLICYEAVFPQDVAAAPERPDWLLQITNDGWFGKVSGPYQHLAQARLRAIEQGLPLVRAANTGVSAVIDAKGRVVRSLPLGEVGVIDAALPGALPPTIYAGLGDAPVGLVLLAGLLLLLGRRLSGPRQLGKH